jgi:hypothetical protein
MEWPGDLSIAKLNARDSLLGAVFGWIGGFSADHGLGADLNEREMRRIRAKQIGAVTRLVPITMTVNLVNVAIILGVFWDSVFENLSRRLGAGDCIRHLSRDSVVATDAPPVSNRGVAQGNEADDRPGVHPGAAVGGVAGGAASRG